MPGAPLRTMPPNRGRSSPEHHARGLFFPSPVPSSPGMRRRHPQGGSGGGLPRLGSGGGAANLAQRRARIPLDRQIPERHNAHRLPPVDHRQAANGMGAHEPHRLLDAVRGRHGE